MTEHCPPDDCHAGHELTPLQARALLALVIDCALPDAPLPGAPGPDARQSSAARADAANTRGSGGIPRQALYFCTLAMVLLGFSRADSVLAPIDESPRDDFSIRASNGGPSRGSVLSRAVRPSPAPRTPQESPMRPTLRSLATAAAITGSVAASANSADLHVPSQYPTIQAAIDAASSGDRVIVADGIYPERLRMVGKAVNLQGTDQARAIVDGGGASGGFLLEVRANSNQPFSIRGLTFRNSTSNGVVVGGSSGLVMSDCTISDCSGTYGAALICSGGSAQYQRVLFLNNSAFNGGAINTTQAFQGAFIDSVFDGNRATNAGAAIIDYEGSSTLLRNCVFRNHTVGNSVIFGYVNAQPRVESSLFCANSIPAWAACCGATVIDLGGNTYASSCIPDCNSDGISDADQVARGELADYNSNRIPDCCEAGTPCELGNHPLEWRAADGGNGHWYMAVRPFGTVSSWTMAQDYATARGGYLVTVTSAPEQALIERLFAGDQSCQGDRNGIFLGGRQAPGNPPAAAWSWVSGEPWAYTNWASTEPNDFGGFGEDYLMMVTEDMRWYDIVLGGAYLPCAYSAVIEWSADCNGDGIVDYGQILRGQLLDVDANGVPDTCECQADVNRNGAVDGVDLAAVLGAWGTGGSAGLYADISGDGIVNGTDLAFVLGGWGPCQ